MSVSSRSLSRRFGAIGVAATAAVALVATYGVHSPGARAAGAAAVTPPTMAQDFTKTEAPTPEFLSTTSGHLALSQQTVAGLAQQKYGERSGLTSAQRVTAQSGMLSSLSYPAAANAAGTTVVASAVGVLAAHATTPESSAAPGCSTAAGGSVSHLMIVGSGTSYSLQVSRPQRAGLASVGSWPLTSVSGEKPLALTVLDPNCKFDGPSVAAVTYPSGVYFFDYTGNADAPFTVTGDDKHLEADGVWLTGGDRALASTHVNADTSYDPVPSDDDNDGGSDDPDNATMLVVTSGAQATATVNRLQLAGTPQGGGDAPLSDTTVTVTTPAVPTAASIAYSNNRSQVSDYVLATRSGAGSAARNSVWFGQIAASSTAAPASEPKACEGTGLPALSVADSVLGDDDLTGVACATPTSSGSSLERWSNYTTDTDGDAQQFPDGLVNHDVIGLPGLRSAHPFVTWPCVLLDDYASEEGSSGACSSDIAADVTGTPAAGAPRLYAVPVIGGAGVTVSRSLAGAPKGASTAVDQLPLDDSTIEVHNSSTQAREVTSNPIPILYLMPAPMITGLEQPTGGPPVSFGITDSKGHERSSSFTTSVGGSVSASIGEPEIAAADLAVSAEQSTNTTQGSSDTVSVGETLNDNGNEPDVVYTVRPEWRWYGTVTNDSTGIGVVHHAQVLTQIAADDPRTPPRIDVDSVQQLGLAHPAFRRTGTYGATLSSVFGPGVFGGNGRTVADADPRDYPTFTSKNLTPRYGSSDYCDTHGGSVGVTTVNSGVDSPFTRADTTAAGRSFLTGSRQVQTVTVGDSNSPTNTVSIESGASASYASDFSVSASAGLTVGGVSVTADAGFTEGNETSVSTSRSTDFSSEIGNIVGASASSLPGSVRNAIDRALLRSQTYDWDAFICHRTTPLPGAGQTAALVLGFEVSNFHGLSDIPTARVPRPIVGGTTAKKAKVVKQRAELAFTTAGDASVLQTVVQRAGGRGAAVLRSAARTPAQAERLSRRQSSRLPKLTAGVYRYRVSAIDFTGRVHTSSWRYIRLR